MALNVLTPLMLWNSFSFDKKPRTEIISTKQGASVITNKLYIDGRSTKTGTVKVFGVSSRPKDVEGDLPTLIVFTGDGEEICEKIATYIAKKGYYAFVVSLYGDRGDQESHTYYPDDISYANYEESKDSLGQLSRRKRKFGIQSEKITLE